MNKQDTNNTGCTLCTHRSDDYALKGMKIIATRTYYYQICKKCYSKIPVPKNNYVQKNKDHRKLFWDNLWDSLIQKAFNG